MRSSTSSYTEPGTRKGDPVEADALGAVFGKAPRRQQPLRVASAKTNIGHLEGAAGITGLRKAALCVWHGQLPPSLNFSSPNPGIPLDELNLRVQQSLTEWPNPDGQRVAGVSSFGMGDCRGSIRHPQGRRRNQRFRRPEP